MIFIGSRDMDVSAESVRFHGEGPQGAKSKGEDVANTLAAIKERQV